ncbi:hypothetical protein ACFWPA_01710 [Rhodococcus sp. NPDC058505]|uniref:hypothetical protein n=1 Tax=unclassified Rhodococcus (in: high G+C Gram-positive bacteria) TaxID=192944 RepID=UPI003666EA89
MELVEYVFGTGVGDPHAWVSPADLDLGPPGGLDAVALDFDGDGWRDDALWDRDGDGVAEFSVLDVGTETARYFTDPGGAGTWASETGSPDLPAPAARTPAAAGAAPDDGGTDTGIDTDGDGRVDAMLMTWGRSTELHIDTDGDGVLDLVLADTDGDGRLDTPPTDSAG